MQAALRALTALHCTARGSCLHPCSHQGDTDASKFYVLERGGAEARLYRDEWGEERAVKQYEPGRWDLGGGQPAEAGGGWLACGRGVCGTREPAAGAGVRAGRWEAGGPGQAGGSAAHRLPATPAAAMASSRCCKPLTIRPKSLNVCVPIRSGFGELALLYSAPRAATVAATADGKLWVMERAVYAAIRHTDQQQMAEEKRRLVERVPMLAVLAPVRA